MFQYYDDVNNVNIVYISLPQGINECVTPNEDGTYTIFISTQICEEKQRNAFNHAMSHIRNDDFGKCCVGKIEKECHNGI